MKKRIISVFLAAFIILGAMPASASGGLSNFKKVNSYTNRTFSDVSSGSWFAENVKQSYELGLFLGIGDGRFVPRGDISVIQTITVACRIHKIYNEGNADFEKTSPWHTAYMDYAVKNGIVKRGEFTNLEKSATRAQFAYILANALPSREYGKINSVNKGEIPDVMGNEYFADAVYTLYNAGIIIGSDDYGTFAPNTPIERSGVAAIATRMADTSLRLKKANPYSREVKTNVFSLRVPSELECICNITVSEEFNNYYINFVSKDTKDEVSFTIEAIADYSDEWREWYENDYDYEQSITFNPLVRENIWFLDEYFYDYYGDIITKDGQILHVLSSIFDENDIDHRIFSYIDKVFSTFRPTNGTFIPVPSYNCYGWFDEWLGTQNYYTPIFTYYNQEYSNWRDAYQAILENYSYCGLVERVNNNGWDFDYRFISFGDPYYSVYDIENDGIPELFVNAGTCMADMLWYVYKYYPSVKRATMIDAAGARDGDICGVDGENAFYSRYGVSGVCVLEKYTIQNGVLTGDCVFDCDFREDHDFCQEVYDDIKPCEKYSIYDNSGLNWTKNNDAGNRHIVDNLHAPLSDSFN